jgi:hypothetical protein
MALQTQKDKDESKLRGQRKKDESIQCFEVCSTKLASSLKMLQHDAMQGLKFSFAIAYIAVHQ